VAFYFREGCEVCWQSQFGHVGFMEGLWLADGVGGECEREARGVGFTRKAGCCKL
jgi:hypothetical protein